MPHHRSGGGQLSQGVAGTLKSRETHAPDGGSIADYPKGWRFLPPDGMMPAGSKMWDGSPADGYTIHEIMKGEVHMQPKNSPPIGLQEDRGHPRRIGRAPQVVEALKFLHGAQYNYRDPEKVQEAKNTIAQAHYDLVIAPQIKAQEEAEQKKREEALAEYNRLKMRVQELETQKRPTPEPTVETTPVNYLPLGIVAVVVIGVVLLLRRRA